MRGDACETDLDGDNIPDAFDNCPFNNSNTNQMDSDKDGVGDICDNCITTPNPQQV